jgi:hypothetical protein
MIRTRTRVLTFSTHPQVPHVRYLCRPLLQVPVHHLDEHTLAFTSVMDVLADTIETYLVTDDEKFVEVLVNSEITQLEPWCGHSA